MPTDELRPYNFQDIGEALVVQDAVEIVPALLAKLLVGLLVGPQLPGLLIFDLQFV